MRVGTLRSLLLVFSVIVGCATPAASKPPEDVALGVAVPTVYERTAEEIAAIWEGCRTGSNEAATTPVATAHAGAPEERGMGPRGSLSKEQIRATIETRIGEVRVCYEQALLTTPSLAGRVVTKFVIAGDGSVEQAAVIEAPPNLSDPGACIVERIRHWMFPKPDNGGVVIVEYPFVLESEDADPAYVDAARTIFDAHLNDFRRCYARALLQQPTAAGVVGVFVAIAPTGKVFHSLTYENETEIRELGCCMETVARSWRFAEHTHGSLSVTYAVKFDPNGP